MPKENISNWWPVCLAAFVTLAVWSAIILDQVLAWGEKAAILIAYLCAFLITELALMLFIKWADAPSKDTTE